MSAKEDKIFRYDDGSAEVWADPFAIDYAFMRASEAEDMVTLDKWLRGVPRDEDGTPKTDDPNFRLHWRNYTEACHRYVPMVRKAFGLADFDPKTGEGLTTTDVMKIWIDYQNWRGGVKKNIESPPTSATPTDSAPDSSPGQWALKPGTAST